MKTEPLLRANDGIARMWELLVALANPFETHPAAASAFNEQIGQTTRAMVVGDADTLRCLSSHVSALRGALARFQLRRSDVDKEERLHAAAEAAIPHAMAAVNEANKTFDEIVRSGDQAKAAAAAQSSQRAMDAHSRAIVHERTAFFALSAKRHAFWRDCVDDLIALRPARIALLATIRRELEQTLATPELLQEVLWAEDAWLASTREHAAAEFARLGGIT